MLSLEALRIICPHTPRERLSLFVGPLAEVFAEYNVSTQAREDAFIAQFATETDGFQHLEENLFYTTVDAILAATKPRWKGVSRDDVAGFTRSPELLAAHVYANRNGNGDEASGDGWRYRGRGLPHLTFRGNYERAERDLKLPLVDDPDLAARDIRVACLVGGWFWRDCQGNRFADSGEFEALTRHINGGLNGFATRTAYLARCRKAREQAA